MGIKYKVDIIRLKKILVEKGLDKNTDLAVATGIDRNRVGALLSGKINPSTDMMYKVASALNLSSEVAGSIFFASNLTQ